MAPNDMGCAQSDRTKDLTGSHSAVELVWHHGQRIFGGACNVFSCLGLLWKFNPDTKWQFELQLLNYSNYKVGNPLIAFLFFSLSFFLFSLFWGKGGQKFELNQSSLIANMLLWQNKGTINCKNSKSNIIASQSQLYYQLQGEFRARWHELLHKLWPDSHRPSTNACIICEGEPD